MALVNVPLCSQSMWRALELCNSLKRKLQIRGNLWLSPSRISPTFEAGVTRDELFEEKASWLLSILYGVFLEINSFASNFVRLAIDPLPPPCSCTEMVALAESQ